MTLGSIKNIPFEWFDMSTYTQTTVFIGMEPTYKVDGQRVNRVYGSIIPQLDLLLQRANVRLWIQFLFKEPWEEMVKLS